MARRKLLWQLLPVYIALVLVLLGAAVWSASLLAREFYSGWVFSDLQARAALAEETIRPLLREKDYAQVQQMCVRLGKKSGTRLTVILPSGEVVGDTLGMPEVMDNHAQRKEIREALRRGQGSSARYSYTLSRDMLYRAMPIEEDGRTLGILRVSIWTSSLDQTLGAIQRAAMGIGLAVAIAIGLLLISGSGWWISRRIHRPLNELTRAVGRLAQGDLDQPLPDDPSDEIGQLDDAVKQMVAAWSNRFQTLTNRGRQHDAIMASMNEGVLAVDNQQGVVDLNPYVAKLFRVDTASAHGRILHEVIRSAELHELVGEVLASGEPSETELVVYEAEPINFHAYGMVLRSTTGTPLGALVVLNNVTRLRQLENVRRDFVANVSHELRTPVTSIRGFVETLLDGALEKPEDARHFLDIIATQTDRLRAIIDDLLELSRIEEEAERAEIELGLGSVKDVLEAAVQVCRVKADEKQMRIELDCDEQLTAVINPPLLEQAVINLIDNAVKYSPAGGIVWVEAVRHDDELEIQVRDAGCGIPSQHLPRIFERFYRVDKARSRKLGGTGLGLAIVKHIAQAHGGRATVQSTPGKGSTFAIHFPAAC